MGKEILEIPYYRDGQIKNFFVKDNNIFTIYYINSKKINTIKEVYTKENYETVQKEYLCTIDDYLNNNIANYNIISDKYDKVKNTRKGICRLMMITGLIFLIIPCIGSIIDNINLIYTGIIFSPVGALMLYVGSDTLNEYRQISSEYNKYIKLKELSSNLKNKKIENTKEYTYRKASIRYNSHKKFNGVKKKIRKK